MLELMIVLSIAAILAISSFVFVGFMGGVKLQSAAEKLSGDLRYARNQAMLKASWYGVSFETDPKNNYYVYQTDGSIDTIEVDPADYTKTLIVNVNDKFGAVIMGVTLEGGLKKVEFNGLGKPYTDYYGWSATTESTIVLGIGTETKTVSITPNTGKIDIQ